MSYRVARCKDTFHIQVSQMEHIAVHNGFALLGICWLKHTVIAVLRKLCTVVGERLHINVPFLPGHGQLCNILFMKINFIKQACRAAMINADMGHGTNHRLVCTDKARNIIAQLAIQAVTAVDDKHLLIADEYHQGNPVDR